MFAIAEDLLGGSRLTVMCEDGRSRMARIPGKMKRRRWIKPRDLLIVKPWSFQDEKADVVYRYLPAASNHLSRKRKLPSIIDIF